MTYKEADALLRNRDSKKLRNNTYLERRGNNIAVRLHRTDVVIFTPTYTELTTGGWPTVTTKDRLEIAGIRVSGSKLGWNVYLNGEGWDTGGHPFFNGIRISPDATELLTDQPNSPKYFEPVKTERVGW